MRSGDLREPLPVIFPARKTRLAAWRLWSNRRVKLSHILQPPSEATGGRGRTESFGLAIQDTTTLNDDGCRATQGRDDLGGAPLTGLVMSAREASPRAGTAPLDWRWLTTADEAPDQTSARRILRGVELRGSIERFFHALKVGTRIKDRRLDEANDRRQCLAFDAITAFRVWDLMRLARERPHDPASRSVPRSESRVLLARARPRCLPGAHDPPDRMTIQTWVVLTAGLAGFYPSQRQPMPGTQKLWQGLQLLKA